MIARLYGEEKESMEGSSVIHDQVAITAFINNLDNPFLVSFPRTGSHWLRMLMEIYFERPSLVRVFYYPERIDYLTLHTHDLDLDVERKRVIYLYRDPVNTIFSQLNYYQDDIYDEKRIVYWADLYGRHLNKWLLRDGLSGGRVLIRYEMLKQDIQIEFSKIATFFDEKLDSARLQAAVERVTKHEVKKKTSDDQQVINLAPDYEKQRENFGQQKSGLIWNTLLLNRYHLLDYFDHLNFLPVQNRSN